MTDQRLEHLACGGTGLDIDLAHGARAIQWTVDELTLLRAAAPSSIDYGMYPMAPWAGRVRDNQIDGRTLSPNHGPWAIHGHVLDSPTVVIDRTRDDSMQTLAAQTRVSAGPRWPWSMRALVQWTVSRDEVRTRIEVWSEDEPFPAVVGWHPWFSRLLERGDEAVWTMRPDVMAERGEDHLPTGVLMQADLTQGAFDDAYHVPDGMATIRWPGALRVDIASAPWFVVYDQRPDFICIEPQTGPPNGINESLTTCVEFATRTSPVVQEITWSITREA